jgi:GNAT superfamily N-acetyltransferase
VTNSATSGGPADRGPGEKRPDGAEPGATKAPPSGVVIDRVSHEDIPEICALYKRVWEGAKGDLPPEFLKTAIPTPLEFTSRMEGVTYFVAREGKRLLGAVGCAPSDGSCRLVDLAVDPDTRRKGVGAALLGFALDWARKNRLNSVWVQALAPFEAAAGLFRRSGFREAGTLHRLYYNRDVNFFERVL